MISKPWSSGECIPSQKQPPYADLGMVVARSYRGRGLGSFLLTRLKKHCYEAGWKPICSCEASNRASKKAIEKAGFLSELMVTITFSRDEDITFPFPELLSAEKMGQKSTSTYRFVYQLCTYLKR